MKWQVPLPRCWQALASWRSGWSWVVVFSIFVCARGLQNGLERVTKVMMIALLAIMVILAVNSLFMPGAAEGLKFYLVPDFARMKEVGVVNTLVGAMNQAFFTLSLGVGAMAIFGSYIGKEHALLGESVRVVVLDTFVAITAGLIIFPACFTYGVDQTSGPSLILSPCPTFLPTWPWAGCGAACSSCSWRLPLSPRCWPCLKTSSAAIWS